MMKDNALKLYDHKGGADRIVFGTSGNVGIGTTSPIGTLDVKLAANQHINFIPNVNGTFNGTPGIVSINDVNNAYTPMGFYASQYYFGGGNIGIGTSAPQSSLHVDIPGSCNPISGLTIDVQSFGTYDNAKASHFLRVRDILANPPNGATYFMIRGDGNVGIRTNAPESALHVVGDVRVTGDVLLTGADCAEHFDIVGERPEPGTVVAIDQNGALRESQKAYDKSVAGVISGAGEYRHGIVLDKRSCDEGRIPVALVGKVYCKVDAHCSRVQVGDLLTTSPTPGHAMKVTDQAKAFGAVLGKALAPLQNGCGLIPILVALQ
jgi:hypothetical protein